MPSFQFLIPGSSFSFFSFALGVRQAACISSFPLQWQSFTFGTRTPSSSWHWRLLESCGFFYLPPIHLIVNPISSAVPLNHPQFHQTIILPRLPTISPSPVSLLYQLITLPNVFFVYHTPKFKLFMESLPTRLFCTPPFRGAQTFFYPYRNKKQNSLLLLLFVPTLILIPLF